MPNEREQQTTRIELQNPAGMLPFAFADVPGWKREIVSASDGSIDRIVWTGTLAVDGFVEFSFLAGTPEAAGDVQWKALQTYDDGTVVRWIGGPESENPAAVTRIDAAAPKQNAGGEGVAAPATSPTPTTPAPVVTTAEPAPAPAAAEGDGGDDDVARALAGAGLLVALGALVASLRSGRRQRSAGPAEQAPPPS